MTALTQTLPRPQPDGHISNARGVRLRDGARNYQELWSTDYKLSVRLVPHSFCEFSGL